MSASIAMVLPDGAVPAVGETESQKNEPDPQRRSVSVAAPGTDPNAYVPGSTVDTFGQFEYFRIGKLLFRPSASFNYNYESNLMAIPDRAFPDHSIWIEPAVEALVPFSAHGVRLDYSAAYRNYRNFEVPHKLSHALNADSLIELTPVVSFAVRNHFALSSLDAREFAPGREIVFTDARVRRNDFEGSINWALGENNTLGLVNRWNSVSFLQPSVNSLVFYDYDQYRPGVFFKRDVSPTTGFFVDGSYIRNVTADPRRISDSRGYETSAGVESFLTPLTTGRFSLGFRNESYGAAGARRYRGAVFRGEIQKEFSETVRAGLSFTRHTNLSNFQQNAFYLTHGLAIAYMHELGPKVFFRVGPGFQRNSYPLPLLDEPGVPRELVGRSSRIDRIYTLDCGIRYRHRDMLALEILFDAMRRDSNLPGHSFTNYRVGVSLLIGHRGMAAGRFFY